jgi:mannose-binding lectin 2
MVFARQWANWCLLAGSWTGALARSGGLTENPDVKAISVSCPE